MKDGKIKRSGNSRLIKGQLPATYAEFVAKVAAGSQGLDFLFNPDGWSQFPTFLNKSTLLKDETASILGLPDTAVPDDAFLSLIIGVGTYGYRVKVQLADGTPVEGATVSGIDALTGSTLVSGADGIVLGKSTSRTVTIGCTSPYIDQAGPASQNVIATGTITDVTLTLTSITGTITVTSSKTTKASSMAKTMDITAVGGGGGGGGKNTKSGISIAAGGGGGGYVATKLLVPVTPLQELTLIIGSGGAAGAYAKTGGDGGSTTIKSAGADLLTASGGFGGVAGQAQNTGGVGNGNGGYTNTSDGEDGVGYIFDAASLGLAGGGGGGGGTRAGSTGAVGGNPYGGDGALGSTNTVNGQDATAGKGPGGGGGGGYYNMNSAAGASGCVYIRFHF